MGLAQTTTFRQHLTPGLYKLTVDADACGFDCEELYINLDLLGNANQLTGPWNFDLRSGNPPLVPAYWATSTGAGSACFVTTRMTRRATTWRWRPARPCAR